MNDVLSRFSALTQAWFRAAFEKPTQAQAGAWDAIAAGAHTLVVAPTGSGKTLAAFLWALDRLAAQPAPEDKRHRCRVLYVSPLKALAVDVQRNLRSPLVGMGHAAGRLGLPVPEVEVAIRTGDTPADRRRDFTRNPPDILITTPESLHLLLTSRAREMLTGVETVILDEVHAVAGTKRGAHLSVCLERLDQRLPRPTQRIGLSATVRPVEEVGRFLAGGRPVTVVNPTSAKAWDLSVVVPVPDLGELGQDTGDLGGPAAGAERRTSIWPHVEERIVDLVDRHRSTIVFANSRRLAERLTSRLNELWEDGPTARDERPSSETTNEPGRGGDEPSRRGWRWSTSADPPAVLARAHHGSVSREQRTAIEEDLKAGRLPAVVATSSLELGIDMGAVDLVVQVESPPSVASGLQRIGRAGHQVNATSRGVIFPKYRADLVSTAVVVERMRSGQIESLTVPANPLDVLAQHVVAMCALDDWPVSELHALVRRSAPYSALSRAVLESVLDMLAGRYPSEDFAQLRPRIVWDRVTDMLTGRPGAQHLAVTNAGTIPDRGLFGVFLAGAEGTGRRVGELDEEMVYESRVGDVFTLGTSTWRIEDITHDRVLVTPAPGVPGRLPFWKGDAPGRPSELGAAVGEFLRELAGMATEQAKARVSAAGLDTWATDNLLAYLEEQRRACGHLPTDRTVVVERFRDEIGDWRVVVHTPFGAPVHAPWALCLSGLLRERHGVDVHAMHSDDGIVLQLPDMESDLDPTRLDIPSLVALDPDEVPALVTAEIGGSAMFAARFRECAARSLLLPRRRPDRRQALWQQRQRASQLLDVASRFPTFPIVLEAVRECVRDVFDVPGLVDLMRAISRREVDVVSVDTPTPSPFAKALLFGYVQQYLYEGDSPLAERRAAALSLDPELLAELLGSDGVVLRDLLDPGVLTAMECDLQHLSESRLATTLEDVADLIRRLGPLDDPGLLRRTSPAAASKLEGWLGELRTGRRIIDVRVDGRRRWLALEDAARIRDAVGMPLPVGVPAVFLEPVADPLGDLASRFARSRGPFRASDLAAWLGIGPAVATDVLRRLLSDGRLVAGELRPAGAVPPWITGESWTPGHGPDYCSVDVMRSLRRRSLAAMRSEVEPVTASDLALFLPSWQGVGGRWRGVEGAARAVEVLAGMPLPLSDLETLVLPARVADYVPAHLDELLASGEVVWQGHGRLPGGDGWVSLHPSETAPLTLTPVVPLEAPSPLQRALLDVLARGGGHFARSLADSVDGVSEADLADCLWDLVWAGRITNDSLAGARAGLAQSGHRRRPPARRAARYGSRRFGGLAPTPRPQTATPGRTPAATLGGRWSLLPACESDSTARAYTTAGLLLERHGVLTRGAVAMEEVPGGFAGVYRILSAAEESGRVRRGYFVEGLGASQFAPTEAVDTLRASRGEAERTGAAAALVLAACDPANPYGAALPWPEGGWSAETPDTGSAGRSPAATGSAPTRTPSPDGDGDDGRGGPGTESRTHKGTERRTGHRPARKAGALVVMVGGRLVLYVERGGRTLLTFTEDPDLLGQAASALADAVGRGALGRLTVHKADGDSLLRGDHPLATALEGAGFHATPRGLRIRP